MRIVFALLAVSLSVLGMVHHPTSAYRSLVLQGHPIYVSPEATADAALLNRVVIQLDSDLKAVHEVLPKKALNKLVKLSFWIEHDNPEVPGMTYHPSADWLREHGYNTDKAKSVEIGNLQNFLDWHLVQPSMVLHEMSHAYHHQVLGFDRAVVQRAFDGAVAGHKYDSVPYAPGGRQRAYGLNNHKEYFAELSEAYFGRNDFYPFVRSELEEFDPTGFQMIRQLWTLE